MMRNGLSFQRMVRPTLFAPEKNLSLTSFEITMTGSGPSSAAAFQPRPYLNGTSNIVKKSPVVTRVTTVYGSALGAPSSGETTPAVLNMTARCFGMFDCARCTESLYGSCGGAWSGCFSSAGCSGLQLSIVTA